MSCPGQSDCMADRQLNQWGQLQCTFGIYDLSTIKCNAHFPSVVETSSSELIKMVVFPAVGRKPTTAGLWYNEQYQHPKMSCDRGIHSCSQGIATPPPSYSYSSLPDTFPFESKGVHTGFWHIQPKINSNKNPLTVKLFVYSGFPKEKFFLIIKWDL